MGTVTAAPRPDARQLCYVAIGSALSRGQAGRRASTMSTPSEDVPLWPCPRGSSGTWPAMLLRYDR
jgi:hypothetical protein